MFGKLKEKLTGGASRISGKTDLLECIAAAIALVVFADGKAEPDEIDEGMKALKAHDVLKVAFKPHEIVAAADKQFRNAESGARGKLALERELAEGQQKNTHEEMEMVMAIAIDVAAKGEDGINDKEKAVLKKIGDLIGINAESMLP